jgi:predicted HicB family RNase H-like nuclease
MARTYVIKGGQELTEADIERLADEAERGYDLSSWVHRRGRPTLEAGADGHSPRIAVRVPARLHRQVAAKAAAEGRTVSQVMRKLLDGYVAPPGRRSSTARGAPRTGR